MIPRSPCALKSAIRIRRPALTWFCFVFRRRTANFLATASCLLFILFNLLLTASSSDDVDATFIVASFLLRLLQVRFSLLRHILHHAQHARRNVNTRQAAQRKTAPAPRGDAR